MVNDMTHSKLQKSWYYEDRFIINQWLFKNNNIFSVKFRKYCIVIPYNFNSWRKNGEMKRSWSLLMSLNHSIVITSYNEDTQFRRKNRIESVNSF